MVVARGIFGLFEWPFHTSRVKSGAKPSTSSMGATSPAPDQPAPRPRRQFEILRHSQIFHPKNPAVGSLSHDQLASPRPWNLLVRKQILKFYRRLQADGLKPVPGPPMAQGDPSADLVRVEKFAAGLFVQSHGLSRTFEIPAESGAIEIHLPGPACQIHHEFVHLEFDRWLRPQVHPARGVPGGGKARAHTDENARRAADALDQFEIRQDA